MDEANIQVQIDEMNRKLDRVLEYVEHQSRKREEFDDLVEDVSIVARDAFQQSVSILDKAQVDLDSCSISNLIVKVLQNLGAIREMLEMLESARDFMKDVSPILHQVGLDAVHKMNELDKKGYFEFLTSAGKALDKFVHAMNTVQPDEKLDNKSMWQLMKEMRSPEVRRSLSYSLRLLKAMQS